MRETKTENLTFLYYRKLRGNIARSLSCLATFFRISVFVLHMLLSMIICALQGFPMVSPTPGYTKKTLNYNTTTQV